MKTLLLILLSISFIGCAREDKAGDQMQENQKHLILVHGYSITIVEFDGCQYLVSGIGYSQMITHKGNCNNPIHHQSLNK